MRQKILLMMVCSVLAFSYSAHAQDYRNAIGLGVDFGSGATGVGADWKHFFDAHNTTEASLLFFNETVAIGVFYEYHGYIANAPGLKWYLGLGPQLFFYESEAGLAARVPVGLDYKIPNVPLNFSFDWRPLFSIYEHSGFTPARFGVGIRLAF